MSLPRLTALVALVVSACAAWETPPPNYTAPPTPSPVPSSHYAPPPPVDAPPVDSPPGAEARVAISSVQLLDNCPDPPEAAAAPAEEAKRSSLPGYAQSCAQSTVQLAVRSDRPGRFRIDAVRVLDGMGRGVAGTSTLRGPTLWRADSGAYRPWDGQVAAATDLQISYKLGDLDLAQASKLAGPQFNPYTGPFLLELDVSIDGKRQTIRSTAFSRRVEEMVET